MAGSLVNHSCAPSGVVSFAGRSWRLHALRPLRRGEEVTCSYTELYAARDERRGALRARKGFECLCVRCCAPPVEDLPLDGWRCRAARCSAARPLARAHTRGLARVDRAPASAHARRALLQSAHRSAPVSTPPSTQLFVHFCCALPRTRTFAMRGESMAMAGRVRARERRHGPHAARHASEGGSGARATRALPRARRASPRVKACV